MSTAEAIVRYMQAHGLTFVRQADTTFGSDEDDIRHANAIDDYLERNTYTRDDAREAYGDYLRDEGRPWRPSDGGRS